MKSRTVAGLLGVAALLGGGFASHAQTIYRIQGADGKVTFSDKPPTAEQGKITSTGIGSRADTSGGTALPYELRQVASKYPVVLYSTAKCAPCDTGRALLNGRGIPFNERTVSTQEDQDYLKRISGESSLPYLTIGGQKIKGLSDVEWNQYLDAAGYPKTSALPPNYKNPAPSPLVTIQKPAAKPEEAAPKPEQSAPTTDQPNPNNPRGIIF